MPRKTNPGGILAPSEVVGRDALIERIWEALETQSVVLTAERRIGKTSIARKMKEGRREGWEPVFQDLEKVHSAGAFATEVYEEIEKFLGARKRVARRTREFFSKIGGTEVGGLVKLPNLPGLDWKTILSRAIEDLAEESREGPRLVFFWDEMPFMLNSIRRREGEDAAAEVLDVLRSIRQTRPGFRMVLTGSIGLHHVLTRLRDSGYANEPTNDMRVIEVPPLSIPDATGLAIDLIAGENLACPDPVAAGTAVAVGVDGFPFYVHALVRHLKDHGSPAEPDTIARAIDQQLVDPNDPWRLRHYRDRIPDYYSGDDKSARAVLDTLATPGRETLKFSELLSGVRSTIQVDPDRLRRLLELLGQDHYLARDAATHAYSFKFPLIRRWWAIDRGLI